MQPKIALSSRFSRDPEALLAFAREHGLDGIEYTIWAEDDEALATETPVLRALAASEMEIRYHLQFRKVELAHADREHAAASAAYIKRCLDLIHSLGGKGVITHLCLGYRNATENTSLAHARTFLTEVGAHARVRGIDFCLENLTYGFVSTPELFEELVCCAAIPATIDIGHVAASPCVREGRLSAVTYIERMAPWLRTAHIYDIELPDPVTGKFMHHAPKDKACIEARIRALAATRCDWWLIELGEAQEILHTRDLVREILA